MTLFRKILFIFPKIDLGRYDTTVAPPLGIGYVAETLFQNGFDYRVLDLGLGYDNVQIIDWVNDYKPDLIGVSMMTFRYKKTYETIDFIKKKFPNLHIIAGGPHITAFKERVLQECTSLDFAIAFEGEQSMLDFCSGKAFNEIHGLMYKKNGRILFNSTPFYIQDLDKIPYPKFLNFEMDRYIRAIHIITSRGCPFKCIFCEVGKITGKKFRTRSPESVISEMESWYQKGYRKFAFIDDNFTLNKKRVHAICDLIKEAGFKDFQIDCAGIRADMVDLPLLKKMKNTGFSTIAIGVESGVERVLKMIKKGEQLKDIDRAIKDACSLGFRVGLYFIVGSPYETLEDVKASIKFAEKYKVHNVFFNNLIPIPGTELFEVVEREGKFLRDPSNYLNDSNSLIDNIFFEIPGMTIEEKKKALELTNKCREKILYRTHQKLQSHERFDKYGWLGKFFAEFYSSDPMLQLRHLVRPIFYPNPCNKEEKLGLKSQN